MRQPDDIPDFLRRRPGEKRPPRASAQPLAKRPADKARPIGAPLPKRMARAIERERKAIDEQIDKIIGDFGEKTR